MIAQSLKSTWTRIFRNLVGSTRSTCSTAFAFCLPRFLALDPLVRCMIESVPTLIHVAPDLRIIFANHSSSPCRDDAPSWPLVVVGICHLQPHHLRKRCALRLILLQFLRCRLLHHLRRCWFFGRPLHRFRWIVAGARTGLFSAGLFSAGLSLEPELLRTLCCESLFKSC